VSKLSPLASVVYYSAKVHWPLISRNLRLAVSKLLAVMWDSTSRKKIGLENVKFFALDEAEGVWSNFTPSVTKVLEKLRTFVDIKIMALSATLD